MKKQMNGGPMEMQKLNERTKSPKKAEKSKIAKLAVSEGRLLSENMDTKKEPAVEVPSIRLTPEQIEEIHTDEYSLTLFYATRIEPLSIVDIKREFPEPEPKKAQAVIDRFVKVGLVHVIDDGKFYSKYPENYINYSHYRYDADLEARKDAKVFQLMKEFTGNKEYWKDKTYFSMDAFYSSEQTSELLEMFRQIKIKAKEFANENARKKSTKGLKFRRMKFYDMNLALLLAFVFTFFAMAVPKSAVAGGNDPHFRAAFSADRGFGLEIMARASGGGNDPTAMAYFGGMQTASLESSRDWPSTTPGREGHDPHHPTPNFGTSDNGGHDPDFPQMIDPSTCGGGGHDPTCGSTCVLAIEGSLIPVQSPAICRLKNLLEFAARCGDSQHLVCIEVQQRIDALMGFIERGED